MGQLMSEQPEGNRFQGPAPDLSRSNIRPLVRAQLSELRDDVQAAERRIRHRTSAAHLADILTRIDMALEAQEER